MKTAQFLIPILALTLFTFTSCQKEISIEVERPTTVVSASDSSYLTKILEISNVNSTIDTTITTYSYDNMKRVVKQITILLDLGFTVSRDSTIFYYNGIDSLPLRKASYYEEFDGSEIKITTLSYYSYNNLNQHIGDSTIEFEKRGVDSSKVIEISRYSYASNKIYKSKTYNYLYRTFYSPFPFLSTQIDTATIDANKNIIACNSTITRLTTPVQVDRKIYTATFDDKPSPYFKQNINNLLVYIPIVDFSSYHHQDGVKNNELKIKQETYNATGAYYSFLLDYTGLYTYNSLGLPKTLIVPDNQSGLTDRLKYIFSYTSL